MKTIWKFIFTVIVLAMIVGIVSLVFDWGRKTEIVNEGGNNLTPATSTKIIVYSPKANDSVTNPIYINGKARGSWFFEASFPIILVDENENVVGTGLAKANEDWMTTDFVEFTAEIEYDRASTTDSGILVFSNDNPSGMPENSESFYIPVKLK